MAAGAGYFLLASVATLLSLGILLMFGLEPTPPGQIDDNRGNS
jgi:hypothetical protein